MFGIFKKKLRFNSPEDELLNFIQSEMEKEAFRFYNKSPMKNTPLAGYALIEGLNSTNDFFQKKKNELANKFNFSDKKVLEIIKRAYQNAYDNLIDN